MRRDYEAVGESQFGSSLQGKHTGALLPPNAAALYPMPFDDTTTLTSVVFTQFLAKWFGIYLGKLDTFGGDMNTFAHEWKTQFMNTGFGPNPVLFNTFPYSTLGAGFDELLQEGVVLDAELRVGIKPFGLPGHQLIGGIWSTQTFTSLMQDLRTSIPIDNIIRGEIPLREVQIRETSGSWAAYYNFDQFVYTTKADGSQGIGFYYTNFSHDLPGLILSGDEIGLEIFYNIAATNWLYVTPDIQVIEPAGQRATTAFLTGLRLQMRL